MVAYPGLGVIDSAISVCDFRTDGLGKWHVGIIPVCCWWVFQPPAVELKARLAIPDQLMWTWCRWCRRTSASWWPTEGNFATAHSTSFDDCSLNGGPDAGLPRLTPTLNRNFALLDVCSHAVCGTCFALRRRQLTSPLVLKRLSAINSIWCLARTQRPRAFGKARPKDAHDSVRSRDVYHRPPRNS